jgi:hypothetical protein
LRDLRKLAQGKPCMIRLEGCDGGGETTVLAHARIIGVSGMGYKSPDICGAWACAHCHRICDSDKSHEIDLLRGVVRTLDKLTQMGIL